MKTAAHNKAMKAILAEIKKVAKKPAAKKPAAKKSPKGALLKKLLLEIKKVGAKKAAGKVKLVKSPAAKKGMMKFGPCGPNEKQGKTGNCIVCPDPKTINPATGRCIGTYGPINKPGERTYSEKYGSPVYPTVAQIFGKIASVKKAKSKSKTYSNAWASFGAVPAAKPKSKSYSDFMRDRVDEF
jgi:hypothetical protein